MKRASNILLTLFLILSRLNTFGQIANEPLLIIKDHFLEINYSEKQEYCMFDAKPKDLIRNPEYKAQLIKKHGIKSITQKSLSDEKIELFDSTGHRINVRIINDHKQIIDYSFSNRINNLSLLAKSSSVRKRIRHHHLYKYDKSGNLISYIAISKRGFFLSRDRAQQNYKYDSKGNLKEIQGVKEFEYDSKNRLVLEKEINIYGEAFSKINRIIRDKEIYLNRQFKEYFYHPNDHLKEILINHFDSIEFKNYKITFAYDNFDRLIKITKYHASGEEWKVNNLEYSNGYLSTYSETVFDVSLDNYKIFKKKYFYENGLITKSEQYFSNKKEEDIFIREVNYEYTFY